MHQSFVCKKHKRWKFRYEIGRLKRPMELYLTKAFNLGWKKT